LGIGTSSSQRSHYYLLPTKKAGDRIAPVNQK
jgi:hypothetical protein